MKRSFIKAAGVLMAMILAISFVGCGKNTDGVKNSSKAGNAGTASEKTGDKEKVTITLWSQFSDPNSTDGNYVAFYNALESIKKDMPNVNIVHEGTESESYKVKLKTSMAGNALPDVFFNWGAGTMAPYVEAGLVLPLDDYMTDDIKSRILGGTLDNFTFNGHVYGYPYSVAVASLYINNELFKENGVKVPETYDEFLTAADAFIAKGITPISLGEKDLWPGLMMYGIHAIRMAGAEAFNGALKGEASYDTPELQKAAKLVQDLAARGGFGKSAMGTSEDDAVAAFKQGKAAMMFMGSWLNGDCEAEDSAVKGKISVIKFPVIEGGIGTADEFHGGSGETFLVSSSTKHPDEAAAVAQYICEKMSKDQYLAGSGMPAWKAEMGDTSKLNRLSGEIANLTKDATGYVYWLDSLTGGSKADTLMNEISALIGGSETPEVFCKNLEKLNKK
ncbi:extracellular solute-binding protein [Anaerocolumna jejuensis]|uniref:extracellular solute-binding protein n=1 Tax=Anaerocolumna jejuensis TaxID=259063 RepID=UPI003F7B3EE5